VEPDETYAVEIELWATSIVVPRGYRLSLVIEGRDYSRSEQRHPRTGSGPFLHNDPVDRKPEQFEGTVHIYTGGAFDSLLMLPVVPARSASDASTAPEELT
jgi:predicted acyl esterase